MDYKVIILLFLEAFFALFLLYRQDFPKKFSYISSALIFTFLAFYLRFLVLDFESLDFKNFLSKWVEYFRNFGGFKALSRPVGNYNIPYLYFLALFSYSDINELYLIKLLSIFFDILLAYGSMKLLSLFTDKPSQLMGCFFGVLFLPTVFLNGAYWGQCDSSYVSLMLLGIYFALSKRPALSVIFAALSFGFKLQAVFILPVYAILWMNRKIRLKHILLFPLSYVILVLPAVIMGRPFWDTLTLYFKQTGSIGSGLNYSAPSIYAYFYNVKDPVFAGNLGIGAAFIFMFAVLAIAFFKRDEIKESTIFFASLLLSIAIPFFLPHMHERYFFGADVLSLILAFYMPGLGCAPVLCQFASLLGYYAYFNCRFFLTMNYGATALIPILCAAFVFYILSLRKNNFEKISKNC